MRFLTVILTLAAIVVWAIAIVEDRDFMFVAISISVFTCFWLSLELLLRSHNEMILAIYEQNHDLARSQPTQGKS